jgi:hypothetical protein
MVSQLLRRRQAAVAELRAADGALARFVVREMSAASSSSSSSSSSSRSWAEVLPAAVGIEQLLPCNASSGEEEGQGDALQVSANTAGVLPPQVILRFGKAAAAAAAARGQQQQQAAAVLAGGNDWVITELPAAASSASASASSAAAPADTAPAHGAGGVAVRLPRGWSSAVSRTSEAGETYYINTLTGETSWERPSAPAQAQNAEAAADHSSDADARPVTARGQPVSIDRDVFLGAAAAAALSGCGAVEAAAAAEAAAMVELTLPEHARPGGGVVSAPFQFTVPLDMRPGQRLRVVLSAAELLPAPAPSLPLPAPADTSAAPRPRSPPPTYVLPAWAREDGRADGASSAAVALRATRAEASGGAAAGAQPGSSRSHGRSHRRRTDNAAAGGGAGPDGSPSSSRAMAGAGESRQQLRGATGSSGAGPAAPSWDAAASARAERLLRLAAGALQEGAYREAEAGFAQVLSECSEAAGGWEGGGGSEAEGEAEWRGATSLAREATAGVAQARKGEPNRRPTPLN